MRTCAVPNCTKKAGANTLLCSLHWKKVDKKTQTVLRGPQQTAAYEPRTDWLETAMNAIAKVRIKERESL